MSAVSEWKATLGGLKCNTMQGIYHRVTNGREADEPFLYLVELASDGQPQGATADISTAFPANEHLPVSEVRAVLSAEAVGEFSLPAGFRPG